MNSIFFDVTEFFYWFDKNINKDEIFNNTESTKKGK